MEGKKKIARNLFVEGIGVSFQKKVRCIHFKSNKQRRENVLRAVFGSFRNFHARTCFRKWSEGREKSITQKRKVRASRWIATVYICTFHNL
jgi:hypothetical protein